MEEEPQTNGVDAREEGRDWGYGGSRRFRWKYKDEGERKKEKESYEED